MQLFHIILLFLLGAVAVERTEAGKHNVTFAGWFTGLRDLESRNQK